MEFIFYLGKYCCESGCCDLSKELQDKGYVPALPPSTPLNVITSDFEPNSTEEHCLGTQCGQYCHPNGYTCCNNPIYSCPPSTKCCNSSNEHPWCCKTSQRCSTTRYLCMRDDTEDTCDGTQCGSHCHRGLYAATCCSNPKVACPYDMKCCSDPYSDQSWCCRQFHKCSSITNVCISGAVTTSIAMMSVLFAAIVGKASKYFL